jgi:hypothetical protein
VSLEAPPFSFSIGVTRGWGCDEQFVVIYCFPPLFSLFYRESTHLFFFAF